MAALEHRILTQLLIDGTLQEALQVGLMEEEFRDVEAKRIWRDLRSHWFHPTTYNTLPTLAAIQRKYPSFRRTAAESEKEKGALRALIRELKVSSYEADVRGLASYFQELVDTDPHDAAEVMLKHLSELLCRREKKEAIGIADILSIGEGHYEDAKKGLIYGMPWPWAALTADTLGKNPGDFIVMYSRMKQMKTWVALYCAAYDFMHNNARVLFWSREMNKDKAALRLCSILGKVDYQVFKRGKLPPPVLKKMREAFDLIKSEDYRSKSNGDMAKSRDFRLLAGRHAPIKLSAVLNEIHAFRPTIVYLDSFYHMDPEVSTVRRHEKLAALGEAWKIAAEDEGIPVIVIHQANRAGDKVAGSTMSDVADSDVLAREASLVIRILKHRNIQLQEEDYEKWWLDHLDDEDVNEDEFNDDDVDARALMQKISAEKPRPKKKGKVIYTPWSKPAPKKEPAKKEPAKKENGKQSIPPPEYDTPRLGTKLGMVLSGNRDGTLEAIVINAVPGYDFSFVSSDYSVEDIEGWLEEHKKSAKFKPPESVKYQSDSYRQLRKGAQADNGKGPKKANKKKG